MQQYFQERYKEYIDVLNANRFSNEAVTAKNEFEHWKN